MPTPKKKKTLSDYTIWFILAVLLFIVGLWGGYLLNETANSKGKADFSKAISKADDYLNAASIGAAIRSAFNGDDWTTKGVIFGGGAGLLVVAYQMSKTEKRYHRKGEEHGSARWGTDKEKEIVSDPNDFYNNVILASDIMLVLNRKIRDTNALTPKELKAKKAADSAKKKKDEKRIASINKAIEAHKKLEKELESKCE